MEIIHYTPDVVRELEPYYTDGIPDSTKQLLMHIKQKNVFNVYSNTTSNTAESKQSVFGGKRGGTATSSASASSTDPSDEWREVKPQRKRPTIGGVMDPNTKELSLLLNKLSESNFDIISRQVIQVVKDGNDSIVEYLVERLFQCAMIQVNFCPLYAKICTIMINDNCVEHLKDVLLQKITNHLEGIREHRNSVHEGNYDEFCSSMAWKNRHIGCYQFITELYNQNTVPLSKIEATLADILDMIEHETVNFKVDILVDSLCRIYKSIKTNKSLVRGKISYVSTHMKGQLKLRSIFILEDLLKQTNRT